MAEQSPHERVALLVVDMQRDFVERSGSLPVAGASAIIPYVADLVAAARRTRIPVAWSQDWHPSETPHFAAFGGVWPRHCVAGTPGAEIVSDLLAAFRRGDIVVRKGVDGEDGYSAFSVRDPHSGEVRTTGLDLLLRRRGINSLRICGVATDYCVRASALDARQLGYTVEIDRRAIAAVDLRVGDGTAALDELAAKGVILR